MIDMHFHISRPLAVNALLDVCVTVAVDEDNIRSTAFIRGSVMKIMNDAYEHALNYAEQQNLERQCTKLIYKQLVEKKFKVPSVKVDRILL